MSELRPRDDRARGRRSTQAGTIARHGRLRTSGPVRTLFKLLAAAVGVLLVSGTCVAAIALWDVAGSVKKAVHLVDAKGNPVPQVGAIDGAFNVLLVGTDTRTGQGGAYGSTADSSGVGLNDVTMLLHVSANHQSATVVSFPRDMIVPIPSCPNPSGGSYSAMSGQKMNTTLTYGGLSCSVLTVEQLTGMKIPYAAMIEFNGVVEMSNAVGGVPVCVAGAINDPYTSLNLTAGEHTLKGMQALEFLRTRHGVGDGSDLGRISNQQVFLSSLVRTIKSADTLSNPVKVYGLAKAAASNMTLSDSLNVTTMASMAFALKNINLGSVLFVQYPNHYLSDGSTVMPTTDAAGQLFTALEHDTSLKLTGNTGLGSEANPNAPKATTPPATSTSAPTSAPTSGTSVDLPNTVYGQTAGQYTCSKPFSG
jgi:cell envelope-related function transcriptional attenuator common domain